MEYRPLGRSGLRVSRVGLGGSTLGSMTHGDEAIALVRHALDRGVTLIDTAVTYTGGESETLIGRAIEGRRDEVVLTSKVGLAPPDAPHLLGLSRRRILTAVETSLRRLRTDHLDLYLAHRPDPATPIHETLRAMDRLVTDGKVRYLGGSNYAAWQLAEIEGIVRHEGLEPWIAAQNRFNLLDGLDDPTLLGAVTRLGMGVIPYMPLASGMLTGKYLPGVAPEPGTRAGDRDDTVLREITEPKLVAAARLRAWAEARGRSLTELALAWLLDHPEVTAIIPGARTPDQLDANIAAAEWRLEPGDREAARRVALGLERGSESGGAEATA